MPRGTLTFKKRSRSVKNTQINLIMKRIVIAIAFLLVYQSEGLTQNGVTTLKVEKDKSETTADGTLGADENGFMPFRGLIYSLDYIVPSVGVE